MSTRDSSNSRPGNRLIEALGRVRDILEELQQQGHTGTVVVNIPMRDGGIGTVRLTRDHVLIR